uniref:Uncharacterized protein n=1 Tax=Aliivibrio wodanis TaxID=80852 RepID=A0A5Q4Z4V8_9GAMM|nr:hypothetical protein AW0309160_03599 [Aliivibrio wodanis]
MLKKQNIWWEKTVEYFYVQSHLGKYKFLYPFDGVHERISDSLLSNGYSWVIIEFKKNHEWLEAERLKFNKKNGYSTYNQARKELVNDYGDRLKDGVKHHFIVYGELDEEDNLTLKTERYFSIPKNEVFLPNDLLSKGIEQSLFVKYVNRFNTLKGKKGGNGGSGGSNSPDQPKPGGFDFENYTSVIGIGLKDNVAVCLPLNQLIKEAQELTLKNDLTKNLDAAATITFSTVSSKKKHPPEPLEEFAD